MSKFYVQSGTLRTVVAAESGRQAALWGVHHVMRQVMPLDDDGQSAEVKRDRLARRPASVLAGRVRVSERGFDRDDAADLPTVEVVAEWNQMVTTLDRLERMLHRS